MKFTGWVVAALLVLAPAVQAQGPKPIVGFVDIEQVLKGFKEFDALTTSLVKDYEAQMAGVRALEQSLRQLQENVDFFTPGSKEALDHFGKIKKAEMDRDLQKYRANVTNMQRLVEIMKKVYTDVQKAVKAVAVEKGMLLVLAFQSKELDGTTKDQVFTSMMVRPVIWFEPTGADITSEVIARLNVK